MFLQLAVNLVCMSLPIIIHSPGPSQTSLEPTAGSRGNLKWVRAQAE